MTFITTNKVLYVGSMYNYEHIKCFTESKLSCRVCLMALLNKHCYIKSLLYNYVHAANTIHNVKLYVHYFAQDAPQHNKEMRRTNMLNY